MSSQVLYYFLLLILLIIHLHCLTFTYKRNIDSRSISFSDATLIKEGVTPAIRCTAYCSTNKCKCISAVYDSQAQKCYLFNTVLEVVHMPFSVNKQITYIKLVETSRETYTDCQNAWERGECISGVYYLQWSGESKPAVQAWCDFDETHGWTVIQRRSDDTVDFYRDWSDYENGFGDVLNDYWLGLEHIYLLTLTNQQLNVQLEDDNEVRNANYSHFSIGDSTTFYQLSVSGYTGTATDSLSSHSGLNFSTRDADHDTYAGNCAIQYTGAWWYSACHSSNLNGLYLGGNHSAYANGINWRTWRGYYYSFLRVVMRVTRN